MFIHDDMGYGYAV